MDYCLLCMTVIHFWLPRLLCLLILDFFQLDEKPNVSCTFLINKTFASFSFIDYYP